jgi:hypothetical protein
LKVRLFKEAYLMARETNLKSTGKRVKVDEKPLYEMVQKKAYEFY